MAKTKANLGDRCMHDASIKGGAGANRPLDRHSFLLDIDIAQGHAPRGIADILMERKITALRLGEE
jgi:hypothetical protein